MPKKNQQVVPHGSKWSIRSTGSTRASGVFDTQQEAVRKAKEIASKQGTTLYVFGKDGRIRERIPYDSDSALAEG